MRDNGRLAWQLFAGILIVCLVAGILLPVFSKTAVRGAQTKSLSNAKQLATGCKLYAVDHGGRFPVHLSELEPDYIPDVKSLQGVIYGPDDKPAYVYDWLYFGAGFTDANPPTLFLASPQIGVASGKPPKRVVINGDAEGSSMPGFVIKEDQYEKALVETVRQMRALDDAMHPTKPAPSESPTKEAPAK